MGGAADLMPQIDGARDRHQAAKDWLSEASGIAKGIFVGNEIARRILSPSTAQDVLKLAKPNSKITKGFQRLKQGMNRADLEVRLKASGWTKTNLIDPDRIHPKTGAYLKPSISTIWTNPIGDESVRITPKKGNLIGLRGFDGPMGGGLSKFKPQQGWKIPTPDELALDIEGNKGPKGTKETYPNTEPKTHFELRPGSRASGIVKALESVPIQRATRALGPLGAALDAYSLKEAYDADGGGFGENFKETAGGVAGGWGGAAAGAAIGTAICPGVGTVVGGIIGGFAGGAGGEFLGGLF